MAVVEGTAVMNVADSSAGLGDSLAVVATVMVLVAAVVEGSLVAAVAEGGGMAMDLFLEAVSDQDRQTSVVTAGVVARRARSAGGGARRAGRRGGARGFGVEDGAACWRRRCNIPGRPCLQDCRDTRTSFSVV